VLHAVRQISLDIWDELQRL